MRVVQVCLQPITKTKLDLCVVLNVGSSLLVICGVVYDSMLTLFVCCCCEVRALNY